MGDDPRETPNLLFRIHLPPSSGARPSQRHRVCGYKEGSVEVRARGLDLSSVPVTGGTLDYGLYVGADPVSRSVPSPCLRLCTRLTGLLPRGGTRPLTSHDPTAQLPVVSTTGPTTSQSPKTFLGVSFPSRRGPSRVLVSRLSRPQGSCSVPVLGPKWIVDRGAPGSTVRSPRTPPTVHSPPVSDSVPGAQGRYPMSTRVRSETTIVLRPLRHDSSHPNHPSIDGEGDLSN